MNFAATVAPSDMDMAKQQIVSGSLVIEMPATVTNTGISCHHPVESITIGNEHHQFGQRRIIDQQKLLQPDDSLCAIRYPASDPTASIQEEQQPSTEDDGDTGCCSSDTDANSVDQTFDNDTTAVSAAAPPNCRPPPLDHLRASLHSLRLANRPCGSGCQSSVAGCPHRQPMTRPGRPAGVSSRRRSSAISAKSKAQYLSQYKSTKIDYFRAVLNGEAAVKDKK
uniref:Uncharacterized protein n=1 Tax=Macrostomum lignano TaxID=282301 RepID=A0A1I8JHL7_9PLAT